MHDHNDAPPGAGWPAPEEWPSRDASTLEWARFYLHRLGLTDLRPTPSQQDRDDHARYIAAEAAADWSWANKQAEVPADLAVQFRADAQVLADAVRGPIPRIAAEHRGRRTTDADLVRWFEPVGKGAAALRRTEHHRERGVCCMLGDTHPLAAFNAQIDVDPRNGGYALGEYATAEGPRVYTPRGGVHVFLRSTREQTIYSSTNVLAPGVEVRTSGWALLPSGRVTPNRWWTGYAPPGPPPPALLRLAPRPPRVTATGAGAAAEALTASGHPQGRCAMLIASEIGKGDGRTAAAGTIIGMLARPGGLPPDVVDALAALLVEHGTGHDWPQERLREELTRWRELLTRGPRDAVFAAEVLETWLGVRDIGPIRKGAAWARAQARSLWKTADRREEGLAGAEDLGHVGAVGDYQQAEQAVEEYVTAAAVAVAPPAVAPNTPLTEADQRLKDYILHGLACPCEQCKSTGPEVRDAKKEQERRDYEAMLWRLLPTISRAYPRESLRRDFLKVPAKVETLYPFADFVSGQHEQGEMGAPPVGHGYGQWFGRAYGGITEGDFQAFGAGGAKGGKTFFIGQMADGLAMGTAARILGVPGYESAPLIMPVWVSEMPKEGEIWLRFIARHFGFDLAALSKGTMSAEMPGVVHMAQRLDRSPAWVVAHARGIADAFDDERFEDMSYTLGVRANGVDVVPAWAAHNVVREIDLSVLPDPTGQGRGRVDHRTGPTMMGYVADAVALMRRDLAGVAGVAEDQVLPLIILDPGQRFAGDGNSSKDALDALLGSVVSRICRRKSGLGAACIMTSDTTKAAARDLDLDTFLSASGQKLAADIFAGSQGIMHHCDVYAICGQDTGVPYRQTQWVRVLQSRTGAPAQCFPFDWDTHLGRFRPRPAEALREAPQGSGDRWGGASGGTRGGNHSWVPPGDVADHDPGAHPPPRKRAGGRQQYGGRDS